MAVILQTSVPTEPVSYVPKILEVLALLSGKQISVKVGSARLRLSKAFIFTEKSDGESDKHYGERLQREVWLNFLKIVQQHKKNVRVRAVEAAIDRSETVVSDESIGELEWGIGLDMCLAPTTTTI